jgi:hypothetical protein
MIAIPIPVLLKARLSLRRRLMLGVLLCSGAFVIVATILRAYYSLQSIMTLPIAAGWTSRELFIAAMCVSAPGIKPLFSNSTWFRGSAGVSGAGGGSGNNKSADAAHSKNGGTSRSVGLVTIGGGGAARGGGAAAQGAKSEWSVGGKEMRGERLSSDNDSAEHIVAPAGDYHGDNFARV